MNYASGVELNFYKVKHTNPRQENKSYLSFALIWSYVSNFSANFFSDETMLYSKQTLFVVGMNMTWPVINPLSAGSALIRQNLTYVDLRLWRITCIKAVPLVKELKKI